MTRRLGLLTQALVWCLSLSFLELDGWMCFQEGPYHVKYTTLIVSTCSWAPRLCSIDSCPELCFPCPVPRGDMRHWVTKGSPLSLRT